MSALREVLAGLIEQRAEEVYPRDVFIPPTRETFDEVNALLQRERGHMLDGIAAECYRRAYASLAVQIRRDEIDLEAAVLAWIGERLADEGLRDAVAAAAFDGLRAENPMGYPEASEIVTDAALATVTAALTGAQDADERAGASERGPVVTQDGAQAAARSQVAHGYAEDVEGREIGAQERGRDNA